MTLGDIELSIVSVSLNIDHELFSTISSVDSFIGKSHESSIEHIVVIKEMGGFADSRLPSSEARGFRRYFFQEGTGIYNAMNIGLKKCNGKYVVFLNGGDTVSKGCSFDRVKLDLEMAEGRCLAYCSIQVWGCRAWLRPRSWNLNSKNRVPHQSFFCPMRHPVELFDEGKCISADSFWIEVNQRRFGCMYFNRPFSVFKLGGVSNYPCFRTIRLRFIDGGVLVGLKEAFKLIIRFVLGVERYFILMAWLSNYRRVDS
jgi:glycosyltransferase involved in cell wall biosynthesis